MATKRCYGATPEAGTLPAVAVPHVFFPCGSAPLFALRCSRGRLAPPSPTACSVFRLRPGVTLTAQLPLERGQVACHNIPHRIKVDICISVYEHVSQCPQTQSLNLRMGLAKLLRKTLAASPAISSCRIMAGWRNSSSANSACVTRLAQLMAFAMRVVYLAARLACPGPEVDR